MTIEGHTDEPRGMQSTNPTPQYDGDIEPQKRGLGYKYDPIGNLIIDEREDLFLSWYANGKVREVTRGAAVVDLPNIAFTYDGTARRTTKLLRTRTGTELDKDTYWSKTYYFRDAQGNVMAVYRRRWNGQVAGGYSFSDMLTLTEQHLYGSDRLGVRRPDLDAASRPYTITGANGPITIKEYGPETTTAHPDPSRATYDLGRKRYELTNHLGNVLATVSDNVWAITQAGTLQAFGADVKSATDYYGFGMGMPGRDFNAGGYRYGFIGAENDDEISGVGNSQNHEFRSYDPRLGRYKSLDPLFKSFPWNSPYAYAENRVIDGIDLEGLEYISVHHYANGAVAKTEFYKMTSDQIKRLGGTTAGLHNSVPYGPGGKGVKHIYYDEMGNVKGKPLWEMKQEGGMSDFKFHGLYSGPGSVTHDGFENSTNYDFSEQPIDYADAIAKRHDMDYAAAASEDYAGYLEDVRTLQADKDMLQRIDDFVNPFKSVEGVETPVRTSYSTEMDFTMLGQRVLIGSLATYKQWKVDNDLGNDDLYKDNREAFGKAHPGAAKVLDQLPED